MAFKVRVVDTPGRTLCSTAPSGLAVCGIANKATESSVERRVQVGSNPS